MKNPASVIRPRFIALDSSHLGDIARDWTAPHDGRKRCAEEFHRAFEASNCVLLLSWHHIQELLSHRDTQVIAERMAYLKSLPLVACVNSARGEDVIGGVIDVQAFEVRAAFGGPMLDPLAVRDLAAKDMFRVTSGADIVRPFVEEWPVIQAEFGKRQERDREIVAISRSPFAGVSHLKVVDLLRGKLRAPDDIHRRLNVMHGALSRDITERGDKRISSAVNTSASFLELVGRFGAEVLNFDNPGLQILQANGIDLADIDENTTVGDVGALATFRSKLSVINRVTQFPWPKLKEKVREHRLPSRIIQSCIDKYRPDSDEWKGSDLTDTHLCCLSAYADVIYVDKRTHEAVRRARNKVPQFASLVRRVDKSGQYIDIIKQIGDSA